MADFYTTSRYGYCLNDQRPPRIDQSAKYQILKISSYYGRPIITRCDGLSYEGESSWIVDDFTLIPLRPNE